MLNGSFSPEQAYRFIKVEDYFHEYKNWEKLVMVVSHQLYSDEFDDKASITTEPTKIIMWVISS